MRLTEEAVAPGEPELARTLEDIALVLQRKGSYDAAGVAIRRAERIQHASDPLHPAFARTLNLVAQQFWFEGDLLQSKRRRNEQWRLPNGACASIIRLWRCHSATWRARCQISAT